MSYNIEIKMAPKAVWFTPQESRNYYGRYARDGVTIHWWGDGTGANNHDNIVNYFLRRTDGSVNYVLSDNKITLMVNPDDVAWTSQSGNATTVSIEHQPTLGAEGYKKSGWLIWQLEQRYGRTLKLYPHNYWFGTQCPGTISLDRIRQEADKWARGEYNPAPTPPPTPEWLRNLKETSVKKMYAIDDSTPLRNLNSVGQVIKNFTKGTSFDIKGQTSVNGNVYLLTAYSFDNRQPNGFDVYELQDKDPNAPAPPPVDTRPEWEKNKKPVPAKTLYTLNNAKLVDVNTMQVIKEYPLDTPMEIAGETSVGGNQFWFTLSSYTGNRPTGFLKADLKDAPTPPPAPEPEKPEWVKNLKDQDDVKYWVKEETPLIDITTGKPTGTKTFKKDEEFVSSALTYVGNTEYRITDYSHKKGIYNGVPIDKLTLTAPGVPNVPPVPTNPDLIDKNVIILFLESIVTLIRDFISSLSKK
jgi:hypothetical protein